MKRSISLVLALALGWPPGLLAETVPAPDSARAAVAADFGAGRPLDDKTAGLDAPLLKARDAARSVQNGAAPGEAAPAFEKRVRAAAKDLGMTAGEADAAVRLYSARKRPGPQGSAAEDARFKAEAKLAAERDERAAARAGNLAKALASGTASDAGALTGPGAVPGRTLTADQLKRLNALPAAQGGPRLDQPSAIPTLRGEVSAAPSWSERAQAAGSEKLRQADAVPDDGSLSSWGRRRWLQAQGVGQYMAGKAADGKMWESAWEGAKDVSSYPTYLWNGGKAVVDGVVGDFKNVYHDGGRLFKDPSASKAADLGVSTGLVALNFVGLGIPAALKSGAKTIGTVAVRTAVKEAAEVAVEKTAQAGVREGMEEAAKTGARAEFRAANEALIQENLKIAGSAERAAAVRAQMPQLSETQVDAVMRAHEAFPCAGAGCTHADLRGKYEILQKAGLSPAEIRETLDRGLAGKFTDWLVGKAPEANPVIGAGTGALDGVTLTVKGEALALQLKAKNPVAAIPLKEIRQGGMLLRSSQNIANPRVIAEYSLLMKSGKWEWTGARIEIGVGQKGEAVILNGHHRVMAAQLAGVKIPDSAFLRTRKPAVAFDWDRMAWSGRIK